MGLSTSLSLQCGRGFCRGDVVVLNGTEEEVKKQREAMEKKRLEAKQAKQAKQAAKVSTVGGYVGVSGVGGVGLFRPFLHYPC